MHNYTEYIAYLCMALASIVLFFGITGFILAMGVTTKAIWDGY